MGALSNKLYALVAFSILAGFSETFVPELLERMERQSASSTAPPAGRMPISERFPTFDLVTTPTVPIAVFGKSGRIVVTTSSFVLATKQGVIAV